MARFPCPLVWPKPLLLCLWLNGCWAVWRYETAVGHYILFTARTGIHLVFEGPSFVEWEVSPLCTIDDKSSRTTELNCPVTGTHLVKPKLRGAATFEDRERYLTVSADLDCFLWYVYTSFVRTSARASVVLILWIFDPENADSKERSLTAKRPPGHSKTLTRQFLNLGQIPSVHMLQVSDSRRLVEDATFTENGLISQTVENMNKSVKETKGICFLTLKEKNEAYRYWEVEVHGISDYIIGEVFGKAVTFQGCFVARTPFIMAETNIPAIDIHDVSISTRAGSDIMVTWSACDTTTAALVTDFGAFLTHDEFVLTKKITFPSTVVDPAVAQTVNDIAIVDGTILVLISDSVYIITSDNNMFRAGNQHNLPDNGILGVEPRTWCLNTYPVNEEQLSEAILWTKTQIYLMYPGRNTTNMFDLVMEVDVLRKLIGFKDHVVLSIVNICYDSIPSEISVLLSCTGCRTSTQLYVAGYNEDEGQWFLRDLSLPAPPGDPVIRMEVVFSAASSMLLWYADKIFYSYEGSKVTGYVKDAETGAELSATSLGTTIHQILIATAGNTVIKMSNNAMFFLKFDMETAIRLSAWEAETVDMAVFVNGHGDFHLLLSNGSHIYFKAYPLKTEVLSATHSLAEVCPYISFQHNMLANTYYLDMGTNMTFWAQIVYLENVGLSPKVIIYRSHLLKQNTSIQYEIARGICTKNLTTTLYHDHDYSTEGEYEDAIVSSTGIMTIEVEPSLTGRTCLTPNKVAHIKVGCPEFRHLQVTKPTSCSNQTFTVKIPAEHRWVKTKEEFWEQEYNMELFGCPIEVHYTRPFRPTVLLYEYEKIIGTVEANYILWEVNGRNDYVYNTTVKDVRCLSRAQNMSSMVPEDIENITEHTIDYYWGRHNYVSCFDSGGNGLLGTLDDQYVLMNHSGINSLIWPEDYAAIFMFRLKIMDPNYSFCPYDAYFAVQTYGIVKSLNTLIIAGWACLVVVLFCGVLAFSYYRYVKLFRAFRIVDPMMSYNSDIASMISSSEVKKNE